MIRRREFDPILNPMANRPEGLAAAVAQSHRNPSRNRATRGQWTQLA